MKQDIVERKTALQTAISPAHAVHFGPRTAKIGRSFDGPNALALRGSRFVVGTSLSRSIE